MIFLDTSYINGLVIRNDSYENFSENSRPILQKEAIVTNIIVLVEVLNSLKPNNFNGNINDIIFCLLNLDIFDWLSDEDYKSAMELFKYYGGSINYADCTILQSMQKHGITKIASFDSDFDKIKGIKRIGGFN
ncbi:type II toxin-antitoxin system VapC family toxin [Methanobrevibacter sp.]|uniref:type II toxin-antitoxin system VapC family toxin n=1 Tax=Methanobrevibacter sp. TaxID=66852 RepID=UPI003868ED41